MLPIRLEIRNFLPYRSPDPVRFEGIHLACLTGNNGAGKSSLLDAITWALWGRARGRRDDDLVHLGQGDMLVQLDFEQEDVVYRVLRRRNRGKRGQGALDLFVFGDDGTPNTITEPSIRATQGRINDLLRLDYETFVHSAFLQQGKADAFTTRTAAERKKILSDILGLERWNQYEDKVKERLKTIGETIMMREGQISEIDRELAQRPMLETEREQAQVSYAEATAALEAAQERMAEVEHAPGDLRARRNTKAERETRLRELQRERDDVAGSVEGYQEQIAAYQETIDSREEIEAGYAELTAARKADQALSGKLKQLRTIDEERSGLQSQVTDARARLESAIANLESRMDQLAAQVETDFAEELVQVQADVVALQAQEAERDDLEKHVTTLRETRAGLDAQLKSVTDEGIALAEQLDKLQAQDPEAATCPTCGQPLDADHLATIAAEVEADVESHRENYRQIAEQMNDADATIKDKQGTVKSLAKDLKRLQPLIQRLGTLQQQVETRDEAVGQLENAKAEHAALTEQLAADAYAEDAQAALAELDAQQADLGYDSQIHDDAQATLDTHREYEQMQMRLNVALESLPKVEESLQNAVARVERLDEAAAGVAGEITAIESEIAGLEVLAAEYVQREQEVKKQRTLELQARDKLTVADQKLKTLDDQAKRRDTLIEQRDKSREEEALYKELRVAFSKNGVPAMIIETAIPELEITANNLLTRMTDGRMNVRFNTQKERVTGGQMETLEISIADELGERPYEMYSGGEAFRINFAIRVALSQMLARRAGAHLRTLFIDEGFGTQDDTGRSKLVEAINAIQEEFDLVLVITHIDELRDSFPVHVEVEKTTNGSRIQIR